MKRNELINSIHTAAELLQKFRAEYQFLYDCDGRGEYVAGYDEAIAYFDDVLVNTPLALDFAKLRGDFITSDREAAAFAFACESLGLL